MAFLAKLKIGEETYNVLSADYEISSPVDERTNMPSARTKLGLINIVLESSAKVEFFEWSIRHSKKNGKLVFYKKDNNATMKSLEFKDGFCVYFKEVFEADGAVPMRTVLKIAAREIECLGIVRAEKWPGYKEGKAAPEGEGTDEIASFNPTIDGI
jgi:hypothetical protein